MQDQLRAGHRARPPGFLSAKIHSLPGHPGQTRNGGKAAARRRECAIRSPGTLAVAVGKVGTGRRRCDCARRPASSRSWPDQARNLRLIRRARCIARARVRRDPDRGGSAHGRPDHGHRGPHTPRCRMSETAARRTARSGPAGIPKAGTGAWPMATVLAGDRVTTRSVRARWSGVGGALPRVPVVAKARGAPHRGVARGASRG